MHSKDSGLHLPKKRLPIQRVLVGGCVLIVLATLATVYVTQRSTLSNDEHNQADDQTKVVAEESVAADSDSTPAPESNTTPSTQPSTISIATIGIEAAPIVPVGVEPNGEMAAPSTNHEVGWYDKSTVPSQDKGALVLNGHIGIGIRSAVFKDLHQLSTGEIIEVRTGDDSAYRYQVYHVEQLPLEEVDMRKMIRSVDPSKQGLNIITCAGEYDQARDTYDDRVLVYAVRV